MGLLALVVVTTAALVGCTDEGLGTIDNEDLHFEAITTIEVSTTLSGDEIIDLNEEEIKDFVSLANSFALERDDKAESDPYGASFVFVLKQSDGSEAKLQFFDNILTVNGEERYWISDGDGIMLADYCDHVSLNAPDLVQICRRYVDGSKNFSVKDKIDYSIYQIKEMTFDAYRSMTFVTDEKVTEKNIADYRMVTVGDTQVGPMGEHNYAVLLVDAKNREVKGYAPTK
ncbi:Uncharacterised protein [uncultured Eubacterium sp.]|nr:Uncharacterised protein [uncultured Eubacterium sp.]